EVTPTFPITSSNVDPALDRPMILLQALLRYGPGRCRRFSSRAPLAWSSSDCERISGMFAGVDEPRGGKGLFLPRLWPEIVGPPRRPDGREQKIDRRAGGVKSPVQVPPFAFHSHMGLLDSDAVFPATLAAIHPCVRLL